MSDRSSDPNFLAHVTTILGETGRPVSVGEIVDMLSERCGYSKDDILVQDVLLAIRVVVLCGRASLVAGPGGDCYTFF